MPTLDSTTSSRSCDFERHIFISAADRAFVTWVAGWKRRFWIMPGDKISHGVGVDDQVEDGIRGRWWRVRETLPRRCRWNRVQFDHVVMLAVLEHLPRTGTRVAGAYRILAPGGSLIMTWPSEMVDPILKVSAWTGAGQR